MNDGEMLTAALEPLRALKSPLEPAALGAALQAFAAALAGANAITRSVARDAAIDILAASGARSPASLADAALGAASPQKAPGGLAPHLEAMEPWPEPVDGAALLDDARATLRRFCVLPEHGDVAAALWAVFSYTFDFGSTCPILLLSSPTPRCGKSRVLDTVGALVRRRLATSNVKAAALFRAIDAWRPTLIIDEADSFMKENEDLRGVINSGHTRGTSYVLRCDGDDHEPRQFSTWAPKVIGGIGHPPATVLDRSIEIAMRRKRPGERVARLRPDALRTEMVDWRRRATRWATENEAALTAADPATPEGLDDRAADNWTPLLAIAGLAGGEWPSLALAAASAAAGRSTEDADSLGVLLLRDIRAAFYGGAPEATGQPTVDHVPTEELVAALTRMEERPWAEIKKGKPINARGLANMLRPFGVRSRDIRVGGRVVKGYPIEALEEPWSRYIGASEAAKTPPSAPDTPFYPRQRDNPEKIGIFAQNRSATTTPVLRIENHQKPHELRPCSAVADRNPSSGVDGGSFDSQGLTPAEIAAQEAAAYRARRAAAGSLNGARHEPDQGAEEPLPW